MPHFDPRALSVESHELERHRLRVAFGLAGKPLGLAAALTLWATQRGFREVLSRALRDAPFAAYYFELPALTLVHQERPFEFVLTSAPELLVEADTASFSEHWQDERDVVVFENLSGDATLVVPCPRAQPEVYAHLAAFVRGAPREQVDNTLRETAERALLESAARSRKPARAAPSESRPSERPLWVSTAGGGVAWLHFRLDSRPKYYSYAPFRAA